MSPPGTSRPSLKEKKSDKIENTKDQKIEKIYEGLNLDLKSVVQRHDDIQSCKCLVRFHNCTPYKVIPFWLDFKGFPIMYPPLNRGSSLNIDTYLSHLWFFKALVSRIVSNTSAMTTVLAIPEEALDSSCNVIQNNFLPLETKSTTNQSQNQNDDRSSLRDVALGANNTLLCSLCKHIWKKYSRIPLKVPCQHFTGEAKLFTPDLSSRSSYNSLGSYIYSCSEDTHNSLHSRHRLNVYLVEPFYSLRERCFFTLKDKINNSDIVNLNLPLSLQRDYIQFITSMKKLNDSAIKVL